MPVIVIFECSGCDAKAEGLEPLRREFRSFHKGRSHGFGSVVPANNIQDVTPDGWVAFDPYTQACYCPACWDEIELPQEASNE